MFTSAEKGELVAPWGKIETDSEEGIQKIVFLKGKREEEVQNFSSEE